MTIRARARMLMAVRPPCRMPRLARLRREGRSHGAQRVSAPHPGVRRRGRCARRRALDARAAEMTRSALGRPEVAGGTHARSVDAPPKCVQADPGAMPGKRRSDREAGGASAGLSRAHSASDPGRWNERATRILREASEVRDELERARSTEDDRLAKQESEACLALIGTLASSAIQPAASRDHPRRGRPIPPGTR